ncbi:MAG: RIP metalloprotease RseP [Sphingomonadaceae bacterium]
MIESPGFLMTVLSFLLVIGPLIFVHEYGHYIVGRWCGVKADVFSIGFGREIFGWTDKRGTRWKVAWMPLGGYVKFAGDMNPASQPSAEWMALPAEERARTFQSKAVWQRFLIVLAGPLTNFLVAIGIFAAFFSVYGEPRTPTSISAVAPQSAAERAGLKAGDTILSIGGQSVSRFEDIGPIVAIRPDQLLPVELRRGDDTMTIPVRVGAVQESDRFGNEFRRGQLGIMATDRVIVPLAPTEVVGAALRHTRDIVSMMVETIMQVITGRRSVEELGGPLKIAQFSGQQATLGAAAFVEFMAMISINLGFINLLPIPLLDGGHLFFYLVEAVRRRPLNPIVQEWAFRSGFALLLGLMLFVTLNDLTSFGLWDHLAGLIGRS